MEIVKRGKYYYLKHSFREDGRVVTKEKYLGKEVPKNVTGIKQELLKESRKWLYAKLEKIHSNFQKEWKRMPASARQREKEEIAMAFTYNTNAIEGSTITLEETREIIIDKTAPNKPLKDVRETEAHFKVFMEMLDGKEELSAGLLLKWHEAIFQETKADIAGRFRDFPVRVGQYRAPDWQDVAGLMKGFFRFLKAASSSNPVELASLAHYKFEKIHPFGDGNGRIGRILMNYILWRAGYPMIIIEYANRKSYYKALARDEARFTNYFMQRYLAAHKERV